jgi:hypothetical protein
MELKLPEWASVVPSGFPGAIEPPTGKKQEGWDNGEEPPAAYFNWAFQALADTQQEVGGAITGTGGTLDSTLTQLLGVFQRQAVKSAIACLKLADDTNTSQTLRALAVKASTKVVVAVGDAGTISRADMYDTHDFSTQTPGSSYAGNFNDVLYDPFFSFIAVGDSGEIQSSTNGVTWTRQSSTGTDLRAIASSGSVLVAVGETEHIRRSTTGGAWATPPSPFAGTPDIVDVAYGAGLFVMVTAKGDIASSPDGLTWTVRNALASTTHDPARIEYHDSLGFLYHYGGDVYGSPDGINWTKIWNDVGILSQDDAPGLLVAPHCWMLGLSGTYGTSCEGRVSVTAIDGAAAFTLGYVTDQPLTWWKFLDGQLWALSGDKVFVGGSL